MNGITYFPSWSTREKKLCIHTKHSRKVQRNSHFHMTMSKLINATPDPRRLDFYPISWFTYFVTKGLMALCLLHYIHKYFFPFKHLIFTADYLCNKCIYSINCMATNNKYFLQIRRCYIQLCKPGSLIIITKWTL